MNRQYVRKPASWARRGPNARNDLGDESKARALARSRAKCQLNPLIARVRKIAEGAALMTETKVETRMVSAVSNLMGNTPLEKLMDDNLMRLGPPDFDDKDKEVAAKFQATLSKEDIAAAYRRHGLKVEPWCGYVRNYMRRHPDTQRLLPEGFRLNR